MAMKLLEYMPEHHAQASCSKVGRAMPYVRTHALTYELLTLILEVALRLARRGAGRFSSSDDRNERTASASRGQFDDRSIKCNHQEAS